MMALREVHLPQAVPTVATIKIAQKKGPDAVVDPNPFVINYGRCLFCFRSLSDCIFGLDS